MRPNQQADKHLAGQETLAQPETVRGRRVSPIIFWYLTREFLLPLFCCLLAFVALFAIIDLFDILSDVLKSDDANLGQVLLYFSLKLPVNLPQVLPISVLLSASFMVSNLQRHHELSALRASGLSLVVCAWPIWIIGVLLSFSSLYVSETIAPTSQGRVEAMEDAWTETPEYRSLNRQLSYNNANANRDWYFRQFDVQGEQNDVLVKQFRPDSKVEWELTAKRAKYVSGEWVFYDGFLYQFDDQGRLPAGVPERFERKTMADLDESPEQIANQLRPLQELSIRNMLAIIRLNPDLPVSARRMLRTTIWYRIAFSFSPLVGALLGLSFSIARERGSALRGFAIAIGLMVVFYVVCQIGLVLGQQNYLPPFMGGAVPSLAVLWLGAWQMYRKR